MILYQWQVEMPLWRKALVWALWTLGEFMMVVGRMLMWVGDRMHNVRVNFAVLVIAILWMCECHSYFGRNAAPGSDVEIVCDGIGMILVAMSMMGFRKEEP
jgi:hypothetical protein